MGAEKSSEEKLRRLNQLTDPLYVYSNSKEGDMWEWAQLQCDVLQPSPSAHYFPIMMQTLCCL